MPNLDKERKKLCHGCNNRFILKEYDKHILEIVQDMRQ